MPKRFLFVSKLHHSVRAKDTKVSDFCRDFRYLVSIDIAFAVMGILLLAFLSLVSFCFLLRLSRVFFVEIYVLFVRKSTRCTVKLQSLENLTRSS